MGYDIKVDMNAIRGIKVGNTVDVIVENFKELEDNCRSIVDNLKLNSECVERFNVYSVKCMAIEYEFDISDIDADMFRLVHKIIDYAEKCDLPSYYHFTSDDYHEDFYEFTGKYSYITDKGFGVRLTFKRSVPNYGHKQKGD